jgi:hypothetical protein
VLLEGAVQPAHSTMAPLPPPSSSVPTLRPCLDAHAVANADVLLLLPRRCVGERMEGAAGTAKAKAQAAGEAAGEKVEDLKSSAAQKADELASSLRKEKEGGMTATERAIGRCAALSLAG